MTLKKALVGAALAAGIATTSLADEAGGFYIGAGLGGYDVSADVFNFDDSEFLRGTVGFRMSEKWAFEGDVLHLNDANASFGDTTANLDADIVGIAWRRIVPINDHIDLYGRLGWSWFDGKLEAQNHTFPAGVDIAGKDDEFTWGGGVEVSFNDHFALRGDFTRIDFDDTNLDLWSASLVLRF